MAIIVRKDSNSIVSRMEKAPFNFYLTGSRYFGGVKPESDWDYFVTDAPIVRDWLSSEGFYEKLDHMQSYDDSTLITIMERNDIQVQLVKDAAHKAIAQDMLLKHVAMRNIPKESRKYLWDFALQMVLINRPDLIPSKEVEKLRNEAKSKALNGIFNQGWNE